MKDKLFRWFVVVLIFLLIVVLFLLGRIYYNEYRTDKEIKKIINQTPIDEVITGNLISVDTNITSKYWENVNIPSLSVDFTNLKKMNPDIIGWINIDNTTVNYPYVRSKNNEFYLKHSIDRGSNHIGWTFEDYQSTDDINNIILYNYSNTTNLSGGIVVLDKSWFKKSNHIIKTSTLLENDLWEIFSVYKTKNIGNFELKYDNLIDYIKPMKEKSIYNFDVYTDNSIKILTFITRTENEFVVIHAKMIKQQKR